MSQNQHPELWMLKSGQRAQKYSSPTEVADILKDVLPTYVVKRIASYHAHPLAGLSREMGQQYFKLNVITVGAEAVLRADPARPKSEYIRKARAFVAAVAASGNVGQFSLRQHIHSANQVYLEDRRINVIRMNCRLSAERHYFLRMLYPLKYRLNTKKEILDFAAEQSIKLSMSWTKAKMLMVFNSKYGA